MAIRLPSRDETIEVISRVDSAINANAEQYEQYLKTLDETFLPKVEGEEPTRFVLRKILPFKLSQKVKNQQLSIKDGEAQFQFASITEEVRCALIGIKNPPGLPEDQHIEFTKAGDGGASESLIESLDAAGIIMDLYAARNQSVQKGAESIKKK